MRLSQILRDIFVPTKESEYKRRLTEMHETQQRLDRCLEILDSKTGHSIQEATEEAARFDD